MECFHDGRGRANLFIVEREMLSEGLDELRPSPAASELAAPVILLCDGGEAQMPGREGIRVLRRPFAMPEFQRTVTETLASAALTRRDPQQSGECPAE